jgi:hypothetical protein
MGSPKALRAIEAGLKVIGTNLELDEKSTRIRPGKEAA